MIVSNDKCKKCNFICNAMHFQQNFENWTSSNNDIDKIIQDIQLSAHTNFETSIALEWIPCDRFYDIKYITEGSFGKMYKANWTDGCIREWDYEKQNWKRYYQKMFVALKILNNSRNAILDFIYVVYNKFIT